MQRKNELLSNRELQVHERQVLTLGGVFAVLGGLGYFIALVIHGDLPDRTTEIALSHIAGRPEWGVLKLSLIVSIMLWIGAFAASRVFVISLRSSPARHWRDPLRFTLGYRDVVLASGMARPGKIRSRGR
jgi:hypothetical protein